MPDLASFVVVLCSHLSTMYDVPCRGVRCRCFPWKLIDMTIAIVTLQGISLSSFTTSTHNLTATNRGCVLNALISSFWSTFVELFMDRFRFCRLAQWMAEWPKMWHHWPQLILHRAAASLWLGTALPRQSTSTCMVNSHCLDLCNPYVMVNFHVAGHWLQKTSSIRTKSKWLVKTILFVLASCRSTSQCLHHMVWGAISILRERPGQPLNSPPPHHMTLWVTSSVNDLEKAFWCIWQNNTACCRTALQKCSMLWRCGLHGATYWRHLLLLLLLLLLFLLL